MKDKYYTPTIDEFCVGFEYEFAMDRFHSQYDKLNYKKQIYDGSQVLKSKSYYDDHGCEYDAVEDDLKYMRVKHLDREDIESLELKLWQIPEDSFDWEFYLDNKKGEGLGKVTFNDNSTVDELEFFGTIFHVKNKSEFVRLLEQLNISLQS